MKAPSALQGGSALESLDVPRQSLLQAARQRVRRLVAEALARERDGGGRGAHVAGTERPVERSAIRREQRAQDLEQTIERGVLAHRDVVRLIQRASLFGERGAQVRLHHVRDVAEVARSLAVAVHLERL